MSSQNEFSLATSFKEDIVLSTCDKISSSPGR